jgi:hypothetical protein
MASKFHSRIAHLARGMASGDGGFTRLEGFEIVRGDALG